MFKLFRRSWLLPAIAFLFVPSTLHAQAGIITGKITATDGKVLGYANVMLVGSGGTSADANGRYRLGVPPGSYKVKVTMMGYRIATADVTVDAGATVTVDLQLVVEAIPMRTITVYADPRLVDPDESEKSTTVRREQLTYMPVDDPVEALGLSSGIVMTGGEMHARGGRADENRIQIDGVNIDDPLGRKSVDVSIMATSEAEIVTGGMDPEYGDAQSSIINLKTREGGEKFAGELRYFTDDFGRADKTYTNMDRLGISFGGPTWWKHLRYFASGEGIWSDTENPTIEPRPEHKLSDFLKFRQRQSAAYNMQGKLTYARDNGVKIDGEAIYSASRSDDYLNNWNVSGYVGKVWYFQELVYAVAPEPGETEVMEFGRVRVFNHGPWAEIKDAATRERRLHIRPVIVQSTERQTDGTQVPVTYANFRAADLRIGNTVVTVVWDEVLRSPDGSLLGYKPWPLFEGFQRQLSPFQPLLQDAAADSSFVPFNSATHTPETRSDNLQLKVGFTHAISAHLNYAFNVSRLDLHTHATVLDENGDPKTPAGFSTAGLPVTLPDGTLLTGGVTTPTWYTDDSVPYLVTAYDYPFYSDQHSVQWLMRGDISSEQLKGHRFKSGVQVIYNNLMNDERVFPAQQRVNTATGLVQQGLDVNLYRSFNTEGAVYVQDKWEHEGMVLNGGVRFDWLTVGNNDEILITNAAVDPRVETFKSNVSPRVGVAFPITDRDKFFFHYGRFTQWPSRVYLFHSQDPVGTTGTLGNPNLEPELTVSYQAGIAHQFTDDIAANFVVFNKDIYGLISSTQVTDDSTGIQSLRYVNRTYASSRGIEISLEKRLTRRLGFEAYYTYSFADGVASDADFGRSAAGLTHLPTDERPLDWDQRHTFNLTLRLADRNRWGATAIYSYGSGVPWTPVDRFARLQDPALENSRRLEPSHRLSLQGRKQFNVYGRELTLFFEGRNLLDDDLLLPRGNAPTAFPNLEAALTDGGSYLTETGHYGGAYLKDNDDDGVNEFYPVHDPTIWEPHRQWRLGLGFEF